MSKRSKESKPRFADWEVTTDAGEDNPPSVQDFPQSRWKRDGRGWYTFRDAEGTAAEFAPGTVLSVRRVAADVPCIAATETELTLEKAEAETARYREKAAVAARAELAAKRQNGDR